VITGPPEGIVERNVDQGGEKGVAHLVRCASEPRDCLVCGRARGELAVADGQGHEHLKPLIVLGQVAHHIRQQFRALTCSARSAAAADACSAIMERLAWSLRDSP
jgi:hypothetical protein